MVRISCLLSGRARIWSHGQGAIVDAGQAVINAPGCMPRVIEQLTETSETLTTYVATLLFDSIAVPRGLPGAKELEVHLVPSALLRGIPQRLACAIEEAAPAGELRRLLVALLDASCAAARAPGTSTLPGGPLRPEIGLARETIQDRFAQNISLGELAAEVGLSKFHLLRLFREEVGTTPHAYQLHLRVSRAREMLHARVPAAQVALVCGFADQPHFTRAFKRIVGYTPGAFKKFA